MTTEKDISNYIKYGNLRVKNRVADKLDKLTLKEIDDTIFNLHGIRLSTNHSRSGVLQRQLKKAFCLIATNQLIYHDKEIASYINIDRCSVIFHRKDALGYLQVGKEYQNLYNNILQNLPK